MPIDVKRNGHDGGRNISHKRSRHYNLAIMSLHSVYTSYLILDATAVEVKIREKSPMGRRIDLGGPALLFRVHIGSSVTYRILDNISALSAGNFGANYFYSRGHVCSPGTVS